jgi:DNA repair exonuclease SbcCD nuclease subunit
MQNIKYIIAIGDIHIEKKLDRHEEYRCQLQKTIDWIRAFSEEHSVEETRIVLLGDLVHNKIEMGNEQIVIVSWFLRELDNIGIKTYVIAGNHDLIVSNLSRLNSLDPIFMTADYKNVIFIDKLCDYKSDMFGDCNVRWCLYSIFSEYAVPDGMDIERRENPNSRFIGLFHGQIAGCVNEQNYKLGKGVDVNHFKGCDMVLCGHIHKRQVLTNADGSKIYYIGSLVQRTYGETVDGHGFELFDLENNTNEHIEIPNDFALYKFEIDALEDIDNNKEKLINN